MTNDRKLSFGHRFQNVREIGKGGMGTVYCAFDSHLGITVAIKQPHTHVLSPSSIRRFKQEMEVLAKIQHPNINSILSCGIDEQGNPFFMMPYIEGVALSEILSAEQMETAQKVELNFDERVTVARQICDAVEYLHASSILHRDLKPSNVMVSKLQPQTIQVKLLDFGVAKALDPKVQSTDSTKLVGSIAYMAPELFQGGKASNATDIYAIGCILSEIFISSLPPLAICQDEHERFREQLISKKRDTKPTLHGLELIIAACISPMPCDRFSTVAQLKNALDGSVTGTGAMPPLPGASKSVLIMKPRRLRLVAATLLGIGALLVRVTANDNSLPPNKVPEEKTSATSRHSGPEPQTELDLQRENQIADAIRQHDYKRARQLAIECLQPSSNMHSSSIYTQLNCAHHLLNCDFNILDTASESDLDLVDRVIMQGKTYGGNIAKLAVMLRFREARLADLLQPESKITAALFSQGLADAKNYQNTFTGVELYSVACFYKDCAIHLRRHHKFTDPDYARYCRQALQAASRADLSALTVPMADMYAVAVSMFPLESQYTPDDIQALSNLADKLEQRKTSPAPLEQVAVVGKIYALTDQKRAEQYYHRHLAACTKGDQTRKAGILHQMAANSGLRMPDPQRIKLARQALELCYETGDQNGSRQVANKIMGDVLARSNQYSQALKFYKTASDLGLSPHPPPPEQQHLRATRSFDVNLTWAGHAAKAGDWTSLATALARCQSLLDSRDLLELSSQQEEHFQTLKGQLAQHH